MCAIIRKTFCYYIISLSLWIVRVLKVGSVSIIKWHFEKKNASYLLVTTDNNSLLVQARDWHQLDNKLLPEPMMTQITDTCITRPQWVNSSPPGQNGRHFPDNIFKCIFMSENFCILIWISLKFVPKVPINNIPALIQIMAWRRPGDKPLSEPILT